MNFEQLAKANESIKTTDIKGKAYAEVNQRIKVFRMLFPDGFIRTEILSLADGICTMSATVGTYENGTEHILGTGTAQEKESSSFINKTSYVENCETSAVGRALGMLGIGIDTSVASYEEVENAILNQKKGLAEQWEIDTLKSFLSKEQWERTIKNAGDPSTWTSDQVQGWIHKLKSGGEK